MTKLVIVRGIPGAGKSTLAKLMKIGMGAAVTNHYEADMFFMRDGVYHFDGMQIGAAHEWCQRQTDESLFYKQDTIVSNTFTTIKELKPYFEIAKSHNIVPQVILCQGNFGSIHGVPDQVIDNMRKRFVYDLTPLFQLLGENNDPS